MFGFLLMTTNMILLVFMPSNVSIGVTALSLMAIIGLVAWSQWSLPKSSLPSLKSAAVANDVFEPGHVIRLPESCVGGAVRLNEILGKGRNSIVFAATRLDNFGGPSSIAVKLRSSMGDSDGQLSREFEVLSALNSTHSGFPRVYCHVPEKKILLMELLKGYKPLTQYPLRSGPPETISIQSLTEKLISRLETVHKAGYVHVDVHRRNIMVNEETGGVALVDFGLAVAHAEKRNPTYINLYLSGVHENAQLPMLPIDDIERLVYVLINQFYAPLPWSDLFRLRERIEADVIDALKARRELVMSGAIPSNPSRGFQAILKSIDTRVLAKKLELAKDLEFFVSKSIPLQFRTLLKYAQSWQRDAGASRSINYSYLRGLFMEGIHEGASEDDDFERADDPSTPVNSVANDSDGLADDLLEEWSSPDFLFQLDAAIVGSSPTPR